MNSPSRAGDADRRAWRVAVAIALTACALRVLYLFAFSSWELVADEAHYWEWSRRLDWSYYTKGPGVAWAIWLSTSLFGNSPGAVRLPAALAGGVTMLAGAALARDITGRQSRAPIYAVLALLLAPGFFATAQLLTTDVFYAAAWTLAAWFAFRATRPDASAVRRVLTWTAVGMAIGIGCLFKYTTLFLVVGLAGYLISARRKFNRATWIGLACGILAIVLTTLPITTWNAAHGWPTIRHQLGRVGLPGGDEAVASGWSPAWALSFVAAQLGLVGGVGAILIAQAARRERRHADPTRRDAAALLLWIAGPILTFYLLLSLFRQTQGNWAIAAYTTPLVLVAIALADATDKGMRDAWRWFIGIGVVVGVVLLMGPALTRLPGIREIPGARRLEARVSGAEARARSIDALRATVVDAQGRPPLLVASRYQDASLLAFYLPGRPVTYAATHLLGARPTAYDFFPDTDLRDASLVGRDAILIGASRDRWAATFDFATIEPADGLPKVFIARGYGGVRPATTKPTSR